MTEESVEALAERIAPYGRDALVDRLRTAYAEAAAAHADIIVMDETRIEALVQRSADHADGLQWRRALATVASDQMGISLPEALNHPAVVRAQQLVGAPSYEESLAELTRRPVPDDSSRPETDAPRPAQALAPEHTEAEYRDGAQADVDDQPPEHLGDEPLGHEADQPHEHETPHDTYGDGDGADADHDDGVTDNDATSAGDDRPVSTASRTQDPAVVPPVAGVRAPAFDALRFRTSADSDTETIRLTAIHLGGVANLPASSEGVDLRLSDEGLDIMKGNDEILGRLAWGEIDKLEVPEPRSRRRRREGRARLVVRTQHGDASFEIPAFSSVELRQRLNPMVERYGRQ